MNKNTAAVKCIIWDLDDTLWSGTLAEGEDVVSKKWLLEKIKQLELDASTGSDGIDTEKLEQLV